MADAASALSSVVSMQATLQVLQTLALTEWQYPAKCSPTNGSFFDFIIVGGGTAGCILANRLSENSDVSVLLIEAGGYPPLESELPGLFTYLTESIYDYNFKAVNDDYTMQNKRGKVSTMNQGKMLGGSSSLYHMMYTRGDPHDYTLWVEKTNDTAWNVTNTLPYLKKLEKLTDPELLDSSYASLHGTNGKIKLRRETSPLLTDVLNAVKELGHDVVMDSTSLTSNLGYAEPLFAIDDGVRQSHALAYLAEAKNRSNLCLALFTTATKILNENGTATGVQVTTSNNDTLVLNANKEVIVSAGPINSPKLLMLSGIGPQEHLESLGIDVVADLPVGQNFVEQPGAVLIFQMEESNETASSSNPHKFPTPSFTGNVAFDSSQTWPDYQTVSLLFKPNSKDLLSLCSVMFSYSNDISQKIYEASKNRVTLFSIPSVGIAKSKGQVLLKSSNPEDDPLIYTRSLSDSSDLELLGKAIQDHVRLLNTTYFHSVNASLLDLGLCDSSSSETEYWKCYAIAMSTTIWHYGGTCAMGSVLDSNLRVKGINSLRVIDSSSLPNLISGKPIAAVGLLAERGADLILTEWNSV